MKVRALAVSSIIVAVAFNSLGFRPPATTYVHAAASETDNLASADAIERDRVLVRDQDTGAAQPTGGSANLLSSPLAAESAPASNLYPAFALYSYNSGGQGMVYLPDTATPGTWDFIASVPDDVYYTGDFVGDDYSQLYVLGFYNNELHALDTATVADTTIGASNPVAGQVWTGATGTAGGVLYASSTDETISYLYTINTSTGAPTVVGEITNAPCTIAIAINADGEMYGLDICSDVLVQIDPSTGAGTVIGPVGFNADYAQGMDFQASGTLYMAAYNVTTARGELRIADTSTGNSTLVGAFPDNEDVSVLAFASPMSPPIQLLQNPGFESGWDHWQTQNYPMLSGTSHSGSASVSFLGEEVWLWQAVTIPADAVYATFSFWLTGLSAELDWGSDALCWSFWDQTGQTEIVDRRCYDLHYFYYYPMEWKNYSVALDADELALLAGQTVLLAFKQEQDWIPGYSNTSTAWVDDTALDVNLPPSPTVASITPSSAVNTGAVHITNLAGNSFRDGASVQLTRSGQTPIYATNVSVVGETQITCDLDLTGVAAGQWDVVVTNSDLQSGTLPNGFTVTNPPPTVTSITPASGANTGVVNVTNLAGAHFQTGASVKLTQSGQADINAANVNVVSESQITCDLNLAGAATGPWNVVVTNPDAQSGMLPNGFSVGSKVWNGSLGSDWHNAANWTPSGVPTVGDDVIIPNVTNDPVISSAEAAVKSLVINAGAVLDLTTRKLSVEDTLTNNGTLRQTLDVAAGSTTNFMRITNQAGDQTKYYGLDMTPTGASTTIARSGPPLSAEALVAQLSQGDVRISYHHETGQVRFLGVHPDAPLAQPRALAPDATAEGAARAFLDVYGPLFGLRDQAQELVVMRDKDRDGGRTFTRFQQTYRGVPIVGGEMIVQTDARRQVVSVNGEILPDLALDTTPGLSAERARQIALAKVAKDYGLDVSALQASEPELWIYNPLLLGGPGPRLNTLVWRTEVTPLELAPIEELVLVDAQLGAIALHFNQVDSARNRQTYDAGNTTNLPGTLVCNESNPTCSGSDDHAVAAHTFAGDTYNFYAAEHGRDSLDDAGMTIVSSVHFDTNYANASWSGQYQQMIYGDAYGFPLADDVVAHEFTHAVTDFESNLFYFYQSGAINESLSDVWGEIIDQVQATGNDAGDVRWDMGEDVAGLSALRNMQDPTIHEDPDRMGSPWYYCEQSDLNSGAGDNGGVHINSGVNNKAAYLMTDGDTFNGYEVTGLGYAKVVDLYYEVQTNLLTSAADYADLYDALLQACNNLGYSASDCQEVKDALDAVEMNQQPSGCPATQAPLCDAGSSTDLFFDDIESGGGNWTEGIISGATEFWFVPQSVETLGLPGPYSTSGVGNVWGFDQGDPVGGASDTYLAMNSDVTLPANAYMHFAHSYGFESESDLSAYYDGGVLEYSTNGGGAWNDAGSLFEYNGYDGALGSASNPLNGRSAFGADSRGYISSRLDLSSLAGQNVRFRFRMGTDNTVYDYGWFIDDVRIYTCELPPNTAPTMSGLLDQVLSVNGSSNDAIDLWAYASDGESGDADLDFSIDNTPHAGAGVTLDGNRYIDINPAAGWMGQTDVTIRVTDPEALSDSDTFQVTVAPVTDKTWNGSASDDWHTAANWTPSGAPTSGDDVLIPDTANDPVVSSGDAAVNSLVINAGAVLELTDRALTVEGILINNGMLGQARDVATGSTTNFLRITNLAGTQVKYYGLDVTPSDIMSPTSAMDAPAGELFSPGVALPAAGRLETAQVIGGSVAAISGIAQAPARAGSQGEPLAPMMLLPNGAPAFATQLINDDLVSFDTDTPATLNTVGNVGGDYYAGDFVGGDFSKMYAIDDSINFFVSIDTATAAVTAIGTASPARDHLWTGMAGDPTDGALYGSSTSGSGSILYTFDLATGAPTVVGTVTNAPGLIGIAINAAGELYGLDVINDELLSIDKATGAGTVIGPVGFDAHYAQGMDFDQASNTLYLAAYVTGTNRAELRIADTTTGGTTLAGLFPAATEIDALAIATSGNAPPVAVNDAYTTTQDTPLGVAAPGVLDNDVDGDPLTAVWDAGPANGALSLSADGSFAYTPTASFSGADSFTYHANDGVSDSNIATVTLNVITTANTPPTLAGLPDQHVPMNGSSDNAIDLWNYASDAQDADASLTFDIVNAPNVGAGVTLDANRYVDINPAAAWTGVTDVEVQVQDTDGMTDTDSFQVTVASGSTNISVTVSVSGNQFCPGRATGVKRCFDIEPTAALRATVQFYLSEAERNGQVLDDLLVYHHDGAWTEEPGPYTRGGAGDAQYVQAQNVDDFSLFGLDRTGGGVTNVHVSISGNQFCPGRFTGIRRCFDIEPAAVLTATVQFYFGEAERNGQVQDDLLVYHYDSGWMEEPGPFARGGAGDAQYVQAQNVGGFSLFALGRAGDNNAIYLPVVQKQYTPAIRHRRNGWQ